MVPPTCAPRRELTAGWLTMIITTMDAVDMTTLLANVTSPSGFVNDMTQRDLGKTAAPVTIAPTSHNGGPLNKRASTTRSTDHSDNQSVKEGAIQSDRRNAMVANVPATLRDCMPS